MHKDAKLINKALVGRVPYRNLSEQYGISVSAICRHAKHVRAVVQSQTRALAASGGTMVQRFLGMLDEAVTQYTAAKTSLEKVQWFREQRGVWELGIRLGYQQQQDKQEYRGLDPSVLGLVRDLLVLPEAGAAPALEQAASTEAGEQADGARQAGRA